MRQECTPRQECTDSVTPGVRLPLSPQLGSPRPAASGGGQLSLLRSGPISAAACFSHLAWQNHIRRPQSLPCHSGREGRATASYPAGSGAAPSTRLRQLNTPGCSGFRLQDEAQRIWMNTRLVLRQVPCRIPFRFRMRCNPPPAVAIRSATQGLSVRIGTNQRFLPTPGHHHPSLESTTHRRLRSPPRHFCREGRGAASYPARLGGRL